MVDITNKYDKLYFILSGVFAFVCYVLIILFIMLFLNKEEKIELSVSNKSIITSVNVDLIEETPIKSLQSPNSIQNTKTSSKNNDVKEGFSSSQKSGIGVSELFEKIDIKKESKSSKIVDDRNSMAVNRRQNDSGTSTVQKQLNDILDKTKNIINSIENINQSITISSNNSSKFCEKNMDYCKKIQDMLYSNWEVNDNFNEKLSSIVLINISKSGEFSYTIKRKSGNTRFDNALESSLSKLKTMSFPVLDGQTLSLDVNFMNKKE